MYVCFLTSAFCYEKKYYCICKKLICIDAQSFPGDSPVWAQFEADKGDADISIECRICEPFPEMQGRICGAETDYEVSVDGDKVYRALPTVKSHGALTIYHPADTSRSVTYFTQKSYPIMMDNRYMWSSVSLAQLMLPKNVFFLHSSFISVGGRYIIRSLFGKRPKIRPQKVAKEAAERMDIYAELRLFEE